MIPVERQAEHEPGSDEDCVFCGRETPFWTNLADRPPNGQVPCCERCGSSRRPAQVPAKEAWATDQWDPAAVVPARRPRVSTSGPSPDDPTAVAAFNRQNPVGTPVNARVNGRGHGYRSRTIAAAFVGPDGLGYVLLESETRATRLAWVRASTSSRRRRHLPEAGEVETQGASE